MIRALDGRSANAVAEGRTVLLAGGLLAARHLLSPLENQSFDALIAALLLGGSLLLAKSRDVAGAAAIGAAAAMKLTPLLFAPYLAWRGKWKAAAIVVALAAAINLAPDVLWPQPGGRLYLQTWQTTFLSAAVRNAPGAWIPERQSNRTRSGNQSLAGLFSRYAMFGLPTSIEQVEAAPGVPSPGRSLLIRGMTYGAIAALLLISAGIFREARRRASAGDFHLTAMECGVVLCLMLLASPMTSKSHYAALVLPCFLLARTAVETRRPSLLMVLAILAITGPLSAKDLIGASLAEMLLFWGAPTWFAIAALAGMFFLLTAPGPCPPPPTDLDNSGQIAEIAVFTGIPECQGSQILRGRREKDTDDDAPPALPFLSDCPP